MPETSEVVKTQKEWKLADLQTEIDNAGKSVVTALAKDPQHRGENLSDERIRHNYCRKINGETLVLLMDKLRIPGIIFTIQPLEREHFKDAGWGFHSVGILKLGDESYAAFDQTNKMVRSESEKDWYLKVGNLDEVSQGLSERFGFNWNLSFTPVDNPENSVVAKIKNARDMIQKGTKINYEQHITYQPRMLDEKDIQRPLGLKFMPVNDEPLPKNIRSRFTFGYA